MKRKPLLLIIVLCILLATSSCVIINPPTASVSASSSSPVAAKSTVAASVAPAITVAPSTPAPPPPTVAPTPTPLVPLTVNDNATNYVNSYISVNIHCPEIAGMHAVAMQSGINSGLNGYLTGSATALEQQSVQDETNYGAHSPYSYEANYIVKRNDGAIISILIEIQRYEGGAHPSTEIATVNAVNTVAGDQWVLSDLFIPGNDYVADINSEINAMIAADASMNGVFWFSTIDAHQQFYLTDTHLVILFDAYTIAPGAYGAPTFEIPFGNLANLSNF